MRTSFLQDERGNLRIPDKKDTTSQKKKKIKKKMTSESTHEQDSPIPQELRLPPPIEDPIGDPTDTPIPDKKENTPPKKKKIKRKKRTQNTHEEDTAIPPELRLPTPVEDPICDPPDTSIPPEPHPVDDPNRDPNNDVFRDPNCEHEDITHLLPPGEPVTIMCKKDGSIQYKLSRPNDPIHPQVEDPIHDPNPQETNQTKHIPIPPPSQLHPNEHLVVLHKKDGSIRYQQIRPDLKQGYWAIDTEKTSMKDLEKNIKIYKKKLPLYKNNLRN